MAHYLTVPRIGRGSASDPYRVPWSGSGLPYVLVGEKDDGDFIAALPDSVEKDTIDRLISDYGRRYEGTDSALLPITDQRDPWKLPKLEIQRGSETETWTRSDGAGWTSIDQTWAKWALGGATTESIVSNRGRITRDGSNATTIMYMSAHSAEDSDLTVLFADGSSGSATLVGLALRVDPAGEDAYYVRWNGDDRFEVYKAVGGTTTELAEVIKADISYPVSIRMAVATESGPVTRIQFKVWNNGEAEPGGWDFDSTNDEAALQEVAGNPGVVGTPNVSDSRRVNFDDLEWTDLDGGSGTVHEASPAVLTLTPVGATFQQAGAFNASPVQLTLTPVAPTFTQVFKASPVAMDLSVVVPTFKQTVSAAPVSMTLTPVAPVFRQVITAQAVSLSLNPVAASFAQKLAAQAISLTLTPVAPTVAQVMSASAVVLTLTVIEATNNFTSNGVPIKGPTQVTPISSQNSVAPVASQNSIVLE